MVLDGATFRVVFRGRLEAALADPEKGLALAAPQGYVRVFVDEGPPVAELLGVLDQRGLKPEYVSRLLTAFPEKMSPLASGLAEPFTDRESEVLALVAEGLSCEEIAARLVPCRLVRAGSQSEGGEW